MRDNFRIIEDMENRRIFERFISRFPVKFEYSSRDFGNELFLRDISAEGAKLMARKRLFLNENISFLVKLPDGSNPLDLMGKVVWLKKETPSMWNFGVKFDAINFMGLQRLFKFCWE